MRPDYYLWWLSSLVYTSGCDWSLPSASITRGTRRRLVSTAVQRDCRSARYLVLTLHHALRRPTSDRHTSTVARRQTRQRHDFSLRYNLRQT